MLYPQPDHGLHLQNDVRKDVRHHKEKTSQQQTPTAGHLFLSHPIGLTTVPENKTTKPEHR